MQCPYLQFKQEMEKLKKIQQNVCELRKLSYSERFKQINMFIKSRLQSVSVQVSSRVKNGGMKGLFKEKA